MKHRWFGPWLVILGAALLLAGSFGSVSPLQGGPTKASAQTVCPAGTIFFPGYGCVTLGGTTGGCPTGYYFFGNTCVPVSTGSCPYGTYFNSITCVPLTTTGCPYSYYYAGCTTGASCPYGYAYAGCTTGTSCPYGYAYAGCTTGTSCPYGYAYAGCTTGTSCPYGTAYAGCTTSTGSYCPVGSYSSSYGTCVPNQVSSAMQLYQGCNQVIPPNTAGVAQPVAGVVALVQPSGSVASVWQFNNAEHDMEPLYFNTPGAPVSNSSVAPNQSVFVCVASNASFGSY